MDDILQKHSKFIVFLSHLLLLFSICPVCQTDNPLVEACSKGTMVEVKTNLQKHYLKRSTSRKVSLKWKGQKCLQGISCCVLHYFSLETLHTKCPLQTHGFVMHFP